MKKQEAQRVAVPAGRFVLGALLTLAIAIPIWTLIVMLLVQPESMMAYEEQTVTKQLLWWVAGPLMAVSALFGALWQRAAVAAPVETFVKSEAASSSAGEQSDYVLEVVSLGVTYDKYRQGKLWDALSHGHPYLNLQEKDPKKYPWTEIDKIWLTGGRANDALENGLKFTPDFLGVPTFFAGPPILNPAKQPSATRPSNGLTAGAESNGMAWHLLAVGPAERSERPDRIIERVFSFFDANPELPYVIFTTFDDAEARDNGSMPGTLPLVREGYYVPERPDAAALFVFARRDRVDALRKTSWDEPYDQGLTRKLYQHYVELTKSVPKAPGALYRQPTIAEWQQASIAFAQREDIYPKGVSFFGGLSGSSNRPPADYKPTPWFPLPWNKRQLATFDRLPTLGYLHRPIFVKMTDDKGLPLARRDARQAALQAGWQQALNTLPEADRKQSPARVVTATGGNTDETIVLTGMLNQWTAQGGPQLDAGKATQWINTDARLGNTGAATWFMQMAIGVMGSYRDGGATAAINMRDPTEASIIFITPPSDEKRKKQKHPQGGDVFRHYATPAIDPSNYEQK